MKPKMARVSAAQPITPHNDALYEAGKKLLVDSVETGREFCKLMITTCVSAIPIYLSLLQLALPKGYRAGILLGMLFVLPAILFLAGAVVAVVGYLPTMAEFSLDLPHEINRHRSATIRRRRIVAHVCLAVFAAGALLGSAVVIWGSTVTTPTL